MYYKILVNGKEIGVFGHEEVENIHLSVSGDSNDLYVFASAVCKVSGKNYHYDWIQHDIGANDKVEIIPTSSKNVAKPRNKILMDRAEREPR